MRKTYIVILPFLLLLPLVTFAQNDRDRPYFEAGVFLGFSNYQGEIGNGLNDLTFWKNAVGVLGKYHANRLVAFRLGFTYGQLRADDQFSDYAWNRNRNINFKTPVYELSFIPEFHLMTGPAFSQRAHMYVFGGLGFFHFNPQTYYQNQWIELQPLGTEGQETQNLSHREKYSLYQISLPAGLGFEFDLGRNFALGMEFGIRFTLTDFLDDVSGYYADPDAMSIKYGDESLALALSDRRISSERWPNADGFYEYQLRGDPSTKDRYIFFGFNITKKFKGLRCNSF